MRYIEKEEDFIAEPKDYTCMNCGEYGIFIRDEPHGVMIDRNFKCSCGSSWTFITDGTKMNRYQFVYPRGN